MTTFAILATGKSLSQAVVDSLRDRVKVVAVSDAHRLCAWADALVSQDRAWWRCHPEVLEFAGRKFSGTGDVDGVERVQFEGSVSSGSNSGLLACHVAVKYLGAKKLLLLGFDLRGTHFFGPHPAPLKNTAVRRFDVFKDQFRRFRPRGIDIVNCTQNSALLAYRLSSLEKELESVS